jgi:hypothetical protein
VDDEPASGTRSQARAWQQLAVRRAALFERAQARRDGVDRRRQLADIRPLVLTDIGEPAVRSTACCDDRELLVEQDERGTVDGDLGLGRVEQEAEAQTLRKVRCQDLDEPRLFGREDAAVASRCSARNPQHVPSETSAARRSSSRPSGWNTSRHLTLRERSPPVASARPATGSLLRASSANLLKSSCEYSTSKKCGAASSGRPSPTFPVIISVAGSAVVKQ